MATPKIKWRVSSAPSGRWKTFERRGWPTAVLPSGRIIARIGCEDSYVPRKAASGDHTPLTIKLVLRGPDGGPGVRRQLTQKASCIAEAKAMVARYFETYPDRLPEDTRGFWP